MWTVTLPKRRVQKNIPLPPQNTPRVTLETGESLPAPKLYDPWRFPPSRTCTAGFWGPCIHQGYAVVELVEVHSLEPRAMIVRDLESLATHCGVPGMGLVR